MTSISAFTISLLAGGMLLPESANAMPWVQLADLPVFVHRHNAAPGTDPDGIKRVYMFAGGSDASTYQRMDGYDPLTDTWDTTFAVIPTERVNACETVGNDGLIYVMGGFVGASVELDVVEAYDPPTDSWTTLAPMPQVTERCAAATGPDGRIYVFGGADGDGGIELATTQIFDPVAGTWSLGAPMPNGKNRSGAELHANGMIYIVGNDESLTDPDTFEYDPVADSWTTVAPMPDDLNGRGTTLGPDGRIWVVNDGEYNTSSDPRVWAYNPVTDVWVQEDDNLIGTTSLAVATLDQRIYALGGTVRFDGSVGNRLEAMGPAPTAGDPFTFTITGTCPGPVNADVFGAPPGPGTFVRFFRGPGTGGTFVIPGGGCAGTLTGLSGLPVNPVGPRPTPVDALGEAHRTPTLEASDCGQFAQAVELSTCTLSNVVGPL